jgi:hypothetical protein
MMAKYEHELSALDGLELDDVLMDASLTFLLSFVQAWARAAADARAAQQDSAMDDNEWWATSGPLLARVLDETASQSLLGSGQRWALPTAARKAPATPTPLAWRVSSTACPHTSTLLKRRTTYSARLLESRGRSARPVRSARRRR